MVLPNSLPAIAIAENEAIAPIIYNAALTAGPGKN